MLIEFIVENYLSFKDLTKFSMVATKSYKEHAGTHLVTRKASFNLLKSAVIYGNNASGKSNFIEAFTWMKLTVKNSFRDALVEISQQVFPHRGTMLLEMVKFW